MESTRYLFISYEKSDRAFAKSLCEELERRDKHCWIAPRDIAPGDSYGGAIVAAIQGSRALIVVLSQAANESRFVSREVERAASLGLRVLVVRTELIDPAPRLALFLSETQWIDAWDRNLKLVIDDVVRGLGGASSPQPEKPPNPPRGRRRGIPILIAALLIVLLALAGTQRARLQAWLSNINSSEAVSLATPRDVVHRFLALLRDESNDAELMGLFTARSRAVAGDAQAKAGLAMSRANTANAEEKASFLSEIAWTKRATNETDSGLVTITTTRAMNGEPLCEIFLLKFAEAKWQLDSYNYWPSTGGPCLGTEDLVSAGNRAGEIADRLARGSLDPSSDIAALLRPFAADPLWAQLMSKLRPLLEDFEPSDPLIVIPVGWVSLVSGASPTRGRFAMVRLAADHGATRQNLELLLQQEHDGRWRLAYSPNLYPLPN